MSRIMTYRIAGIFALLMLGLAINVPAQSRKQAEKQEANVKEEKSSVLSIFKKPATAKEEQNKATYKKLKQDHKQAKSEVRVSRKERKAAEAKERAARAHSAAIRAKKRAAKADKKANRAEDKAVKARKKNLKWPTSKKEY